MRRKEKIAQLGQVLVKRQMVLREILTRSVGLLASEAHDNAVFRDSVQFVESRLVDVEDSELDAVGHAMERLRDGQYGICEGCGGNIPVARLNAVPYATLCVKCQSKKERSEPPAEEDSSHEALLALALD